MARLISNNTIALVELIKNDPPLAGLVLKTVNSPYFSLPTKVSDYYRAFLFLGTNNVYGFSSPHLDELLARVAAEIDPPKRIELLQEAMTADEDS